MKFFTVNHKKQESTNLQIKQKILTRLEIFTAVVAEKARGGNFLHFLRHGGNKFYFPPPQRKYFLFSATTAEIFGHHARNKNTFLVCLYYFYFEFRI